MLLERTMTYHSRQMQTMRDMQNPIDEEKYLTKEEIDILYRFIKTEFIPYNDEPIYQLIKKISDIANSEPEAK